MQDLFTRPLSRCLLFQCFLTIFISMGDERLFKRTHNHSQIYVVVRSKDSFQDFYLMERADVHERVHCIDLCLWETNLKKILQKNRSVSQSYFPAVIPRSSIVSLVCCEEWPNWDCVFESRKIAMAWLDKERFLHLTPASNIKQKPMFQDF